MKKFTLVKRYIFLKSQRSDGCLLRASRDVGDCVKIYQRQKDAYIGILSVLLQTTKGFPCMPLPLRGFTTYK